MQRSFLSLRREPKKFQHRKKDIRIAICISGAGSNMLALIKKSRKERNLGLKVVLVLSNRQNADGLKKARALGLPAYFISARPYKTKLCGSAEERYIRVLQKFKIDVICLAGFLCVLKKKLISRYAGRILNIHPALLPKFKGLHTFQRALDAGEKETGSTVHLVDAGLDTGAILEQWKVPILAGDTAEILKSRVQSIEYLLYWHALRLLALKMQKKL